MFAIVSSNGKYHGHINEKSDAQAHKAKLSQDGITLRVVNDKEWNQIAQASDPNVRQQLCSTLGETF